MKRLVFFVVLTLGSAMVANFTMLYFALQNPVQIDPTYNTEER